MGLFSLIMVILQIFLKLPDIWKTIREIMDIIKMLRGEEQKQAKAELKAVLMKYKGVKKNDPQRVMESGYSLHAELEALKAKLKEKAG